MQDRLKFEVLAQDGSSRAGRIETMHGTIETPVFMPVATVAAFRGLLTDEVEALGFPIILANTFHLMLRPGPELVQKWGGLHSFMKWPRAMLTDSGGFQIFSLAKKLKLTEEGAEFKSFIDGVAHRLTPESSVAAQRAFGADIIMPLDHCVPSDAPESLVLEALERTTRWAKRSLDARSESPQALFGIVQGASSLVLRARSLEELCALPFDGMALGGLAVGEAREIRDEVVHYCAARLPAEKPRYVMGIGTPLDLLESVRAGMDMFDCIFPLAVAQTGAVYTSRGRLDLNRAVYREQDLPLDTSCSCLACQKYSRAYLHHLVKCGEWTVRQLLSLHNLTFYRDLMAGMRAAIFSKQFASFYDSWRPILAAQDLDNPPAAPQANDA